MRNLKKFHKSLIKETGSENYTIEEAISKDLAREDSLALISEFVKDVKKKFDKSDVLEILKDASKTLNFFISEIENTTSSIDIMTIMPSSPTSLSFDDIVNKDEDSIEDNEDYGRKEGRRGNERF